MLGTQGWVPGAGRARRVTAISVVAAMVALLGVASPRATADEPVAVTRSQASIRTSTASSCPTGPSALGEGTDGAVATLEQSTLEVGVAPSLPFRITGSASATLDSRSDNAPCHFGHSAAGHALATFTVPAGDRWEYSLTGERTGTTRRRAQGDGIFPGQVHRLVDVHVVPGSDPDLSLLVPHPENPATPRPLLDPGADPRDTAGPFEAHGVLSPGTWTVVITTIGTTSREIRTGSATATFDLSFDRLAGLPLDFDYTARARYGGRDDLGRTNQHLTPGAVTPPGGFVLDLALDDCPGAADEVQLVWRSEGRALGGGRAPAGCKVAAAFPTEGTHAVEVQALDLRTGALRGARIEDVVVTDHLIVSLGDSVASGEGANELGLPSLGWGDEQCHRSAAAGPSVAAKAIEQAGPKSSVTFVHLACSGATITKGLLGPYAGIFPPGELGTALRPQVDEMVRLTGGREIDAVVVSIGANDVEFSKIVEDCLLQPGCHTAAGAGSRRFERLAPTLPGRYEQLAAALEARGVPAERVLLTEYFNPVRDGANQPCHGGILADGLPHELRNLAGSVGSLLAPIAAELLEITADEARWAEEVMLTRLNQLGDEAAALHGWQRVTGMFEDFGPHGYCTSPTQRWVQTYADSLVTQADMNGTLHPNVTGHAQSYGPRIRATLEAVLAP